MKSFFAFILLCFVFITSYSQEKNSNGEHFLLAGTYTGGASKGIYVYSFNGKTADYKELSTYKTDNPSYLAVSPNQKYVYAVNELGADNGSGTISAFAFNKITGGLTFLNKQSTHGDDPCYVAIDKTGKWIVAGNYTGGNFAVFPVNNDGALAAASTVINHTGQGPNKERQEKPHVHCTIFSPNNKFLFVADLGIDKIVAYHFNEKTGTVKAAPEFSKSLNGGTGPRHFIFNASGKNAYLIEELSGNVIAFSYNKGKLKQLQQISSLPKDYKGSIGSADIHISSDGKFLYTSNRGDANLISIFKVNTTGNLAWQGSVSTMGIQPRNFNFDPKENYLLVANQATDDMVIFNRDKKTGLLTYSGKKINIPKPVCIKWIN
ncbi:MAG: lactonase family protein [Bacteroidota bacterium]|nr:lactonase family protein [Bacteroidota bacterium]